MHTGHPGAASGRVRTPIFLALAGGAAMLLLGLLSLALHAPMLFPAIGASAWVVFRHPGAPPAAPRNVILGHAIGAAIGWVALWACVGFEVRGTLADLDDWRFVASGATALAATLFVLEQTSIVHPPAAATTLIVGMGLLPRWTHLGAIVAAAVLLAAFSGVVTRTLVRPAAAPIEPPR